jgi:PAS domain S-box-containing protein
MTLRAFSSGAAQMKANTALAFVLAGLALALLIADRRRVGRVLGATVALIGLLTVAEHVFGWELGIDTLLVDDPGTTVAMVAPGRMGPNTSLCFTLAGGALLSMDVRRGGLRPAQAGALLIAVVALVTLLGYLFGVSRFGTGFVSEQVAPMALPTALTFMLLAGGLVLARPAVGVIALVRSPGLGGALLRRLLAPTIALPAGLGYLRLEGERAGLYVTAEGVALLVTGVTVMFTALLWFTARSLERLDAQRAESAARERAVLEAGLDAFITIDAAGRVVDFSPIAEDLFGYSRDQAVGADLAELIIAPGARERHREGLARRAAAGRAGRGKVRLETVAQRADGSEFPVEVAVCALNGPGRAAFAANVRNIGERQQLEQQLRQSQKMEAVGQLAGGVAHDFNNLLTVIGGYGAMARERIGVGPGREELAEIERACERATQLTRQLLAFSHQQVLDPAALDLNEVIRSLAPMLRRLIGENIEIAALAEPGLARVFADRGQLEQVIVNLALNARDAMPTGGTLTVQTATVKLDATYTREHLGAEPGRYVCLIVTDTGTGMDADTATHIFEPFFTTKPVGHGTGLGLATVHGIITQSGGHVEVYSEPGLGTSFKVYLPPAEPTTDPPATAAAPVDDLQPQRGTETILVCEDEDSVRRLIEYILTANGYTALLASRPSDALQIAATHAGPIAALISDVVMPEMPGPELAERLQAILPGLRTIFVSGYTEHTIRERGHLPAGSAFLEKPFQHATLLRALRALLDQPLANTQHHDTHDHSARR